MKTRCIHLFPEFKNANIIEEIRKKFDPLATKIPPHITLVFPFDSEFSKEDLQKHLDSTVKNIKPFKIKLQNINARESFGYYLFLNVTEGYNRIKELHKILYSGLLSAIKPDWLDHEKYEPHITVGKLESKELMVEAEKECACINSVFETKINRVSVEIIGENDQSIIETEYGLTGDKK